MKDHARHDTTDAIGFVELVANRTPGGVPGDGRAAGNATDKSERVFATIDWGLLVFFSGLFVVTGSLEVQGLTKCLILDA